MATSRTRFSVAAEDGRAQRIRARAEADSVAQDAAVAREGERARLRLEVRREESAARAEERGRRQAERRARAVGRKARRREARERFQSFVPAVGQRVIVAGPIVGPMSVAWIGQIQFADKVLHWPFPGQVLFAAGWELTTAASAWMCHQARADGDSGSLYRLATWLFASAAGTMNYWHAAPGWAPNPVAVSYGAMSLVGIALWELYSRLTHRRALRAKNLLPQPRPRFGVARWLRFPATTWLAWSLTIRDGHTTSEAAWDAARESQETEVERRRNRKAARACRPQVHITKVQPRRGLFRRRKATDTATSGELALERPALTAGPDSVRADTAPPVTADTGPYTPARIEARTDSPGADRTDRARTPAAPVDRDAIVAELAAELRAAVERGEKWHPDYTALQTRTGLSRSWCEKAVRDARRSVWPPHQTRTDDPHTDTRTDPSPRTDAPADPDAATA